MLDNLSNQELIDRMESVLRSRADTPGVKRLWLRLRDMGENVKDEVRQFYHLQRACRDDEALAQAMRDEGLGDIAAYDRTAADAHMGRLVQAFNQVVENNWSRRNIRSNLPTVADGPGLSRAAYTGSQPARAHHESVEYYNLSLRVNAGRDLVVRDVFSSDPYCVLIYRDPYQRAAQKRQTRVVRNNLNPVWSETHAFRDVTPEGRLTIEVMDEDKFNDDDPMGQVTIDFRDLDMEQELHTWFKLEGVEKGAIRLQFNFERVYAD